MITAFLDAGSAGDTAGADVLTALAVISGTASVLMLVYRLGVWRQKMNDLEQNIAAEVARQGSDAARGFARLEERLSTVDRFITSSTEHRVETERWQSRIDTTLSGMETRLARVERVKNRQAA